MGISTYGTIKMKQSICTLWKEDFISDVNNGVSPLSRLNFMADRVTLLFGNTAKKEIIHNNRMSYQNAYREDQDIHSRVSQLKQISIEIDQELTYQRDLLNNLDNSFEVFGVDLSKVMKNVHTMIKTESGLWVWILLSFACSVFGYIYFFRL